MRMSEALISLRNIRKAFDGTQVLKGLDLDVAKGEFFTLLGPSGCGKTTTLRVMAGLERPDAGRVFLSGEDITFYPPERRKLNTVFQNYALFPHMNVFDNIAYGLKMVGVKKSAIAPRVDEMLAMMQLSGFGKRMPGQLSGGQRQRVAIARALVLEPELLLLDEPLGALDLELRRQMQTELKGIQQRLGISFVYITHDQEEAMNMSDRMALMHEGHFVQVGTPEDIYERPNSMFSARFVGQSNLLRGVLTARKGTRSLMEMDGLTLPCVADDRFQTGDPVCLTVRTERLHFGPEHTDDLYLSGVLKSLRFAGGVERAEIELASGQVLLSQRQAERGCGLSCGQQVRVWWDVSLAPLVPDEEAW